MPRALVVAYHFPPIGGAGVQRHVKLVRYLAEAGYQSVVVTGPGPTGGRWDPKDASLEADVPSTAEVHRVPGPAPAPTGRWTERARRVAGLEGPWHRWWRDGCAQVGVRVGKDCDVVLGLCQPYEMTEGVARAAASLGKPWVADLADPWALDEMRLYPSGWHRRRDLAKMRRRLASASAIVMNTAEARRRVAEHLPELAGQLAEPIPNGFDSADFDGPAPASDGKFRIVHTGYLHTSLGLQQRRHRRLKRLLGGEPVPGVDILTRSHVYLLEAVDRVVRERPELDGAIEVTMAGVLSDADLEVARRSNHVRMLGYVSHRESVSLTRSASLLFLPMQALPDGVRAGIVPGKTQEYLAASRPILAAVPEGDARDLLREAGNALICDPDDVAGMAHAIDRAFDGVDLVSEPRADVLARYEWRELAARLARILDSVVSPGVHEPS